GGARGGWGVGGGGRPGRGPPARPAPLAGGGAAGGAPPAELLAGRRSIMAGHAGHPGFRALAVTDDGTGAVVGFGYGFHGAAGQWWHDTVSRALADRRGGAAAAARLHDSFDGAEARVA